MMMMEVGKYYVVVRVQKPASASPLFRNRVSAALVSLVPMTKVSRYLGTYLGRQVCVIGVPATTCTCIHYMVARGFSISIYLGTLLTLTKGV